MIVREQNYSSLGNEYHTRRDTIKRVVLEGLSWAAADTSLFVAAPAQQIRGERYMFVIQSLDQVDIGLVRASTARAWADANTAGTHDVAHYAAMTDEPAVVVFDRQLFRQDGQSPFWRLMPDAHFDDAGIEAFVWRRDQEA